MSSLVDAARSDPRAGQFSTSHLAVRGRYQSLLWVGSGLSPGAATGQELSLIGYRIGLYCAWAL